MEKEKQEIHHEDLALKTAAQYFGEELMPLMGISRSHCADRSYGVGKAGSTSDVPGL